MKTLTVAQCCELISSRTNFLRGSLANNKSAVRWTASQQVRKEFVEHETTKTYSQDSYGAVANGNNTTQDIELVMHFTIPLPEDLEQLHDLRPQWDEQSPPARTHDHEMFMDTPTSLATTGHLCIMF